MNWQEIWNGIIHTQPNIMEICLRLACAMLVGLVIGTEREYTHRPAGMRTHILVALGACVVSITGELLFHHYSALGSSADPARLSAQVITGVGFLGTGTILREGATVKGLTTAASVWAVACLGIAAGFGYYGLALAGMMFIFVALTIFEWLQHKLVTPRSFHKDYVLETKNISAALSLINEAAQRDRVDISNIGAETLPDGHRITFQTYFSGRHSKNHRQHFFDALASAPETKCVHLAEETVLGK